MRKLIFITILFLLVIGCSNNSEKQELQIEDTPTIEETIEEKGTEISFEDLIKELKSQNVITKDVNSPTISNHNPAEYKNYYNKGYIGTQENTELYIQTEYLFFQVVDSKKMIMNDEDLLSFKEDQFKSEKDYFLFWTKNYNYLDEKPSQHWYPYFEYQINKTDSEYGPIIEVSALIFNYRGDTIQEQYFWYDMSIQCGENIILDLSPRDLPFFGGTKTKNNAEQVLNLYIRTERPLLLERINKAQKICQNISYVTFKECDKNSLEKCKKEYVPECKNNDGVCGDLCDYTRDNDCGYGDVVIQDINFTPDIKRVGNVISYKDVTFYNPSNYPIDVANLTLNFYIFNTKHANTDRFESQRDVIKDKRWVQLIDNYLTGVSLDLPYPESIIKPKGTLKVKSEYFKYFTDAQLNENYTGEYIPQQARDFYKDGKIGYGWNYNDPNTTILVYPNMYLNIRESNLDNNEYRYTFYLNDSTS
jgi:hypothetical protein